MFGRTVDQAFYASTVDGRAKRAWATVNDHEREATEAAGREPDLLRPITMHECRHTFASLLVDSGANPKAIQNVLGKRGPCGVLGGTSVRLRRIGCSGRF